MSGLVLALAQVRSVAGDFEGNSRRIADYIERAGEAGVDIVLFPELCLTGCPQADLLLKKEFPRESADALEELARGVGDLTAVVGFAESDGGVFSSAAVINGGRVLCVYRKALLPNRAFSADERGLLDRGRNTVIHLAGARLGITICEEMWLPHGPAAELRERGGAEVALNLSALPFGRGSHDAVMRLIASRSTEVPIATACCNMVGARDELVFGGGSFVHHPRDGFVASASRFREELLVCRVDLEPLRRNGPAERRLQLDSGDISGRGVEVCAIARPAGSGREATVDAGGRRPTALTETEEIFEALLLGLREYVRTNGFDKVVLGLSGGMDSALTAALAAEALGPDNVVCVFMPSMFTARESGEAAEELAGNLGARLLSIPISRIFRVYAEELSGELGVDGEGTAFENLQARIRGNILMALSNRHGWMVLASGNKSELSMGYCTLYGDMAGGFALIKDLLKTQVYEVARFLNERAGRQVIPGAIFERPPTAELREGQLDTDSLPPYEVLDPVLALYVEDGLAAWEIEEKGFPRDLVDHVTRTVDANEYKRRQAPVGVRLAPLFFGQDPCSPANDCRRH